MIQNLRMNGSSWHQRFEEWQVGGAVPCLFLISLLLFGGCEQRPPGDAPDRAAASTPVPSPADPLRDLLDERDRLRSEGSPVEAYQRNFEAIRLLQRLEAGEGPAYPPDLAPDLQRAAAELAAEFGNSPLAIHHLRAAIALLRSKSEASPIAEQIPALEEQLETALAASGEANTLLALQREMVEARRTRLEATPEAVPLREALASLLLRHCEALATTDPDNLAPALSELLETTTDPATQSLAETRAAALLHIAAGVDAPLEPDAAMEEIVSLQNQYPDSAWLRKVTFDHRIEQSAAARARNDPEAATESLKAAAGLLAEMEQQPSADLSAAVERIAREQWGHAASLENAGDPQNAAAMHQEAIDRVAAQLEKTDDARRLASLLLNLHWEFAKFHERGKAVDPARAEYATALEMSRAMESSEPGNEAPLWQTRLLLEHLGDLEENAGNLEAAAALRAESRAKEQAAAQLGFSDPNWHWAESVTYQRLSNLDRARNDYETAKQNLRASLETREAILASEPWSTRSARGASWAMESLGDVERAAGNAEESIAWYRRALEGWTSLDTEEAGDESDEERVGIQQQIGSLLGEQLGKWDEAIECFADWNTIAEQAHAARPESSFWLRSLGSSHEYLGIAHRSSGRLADAIPHYRKALDLGIRIHEQDPGSWLPALTAWSLGDVYWASNQQQKALETYRKALPYAEAAVERSEAPQHLRTLGALHHNIGDLLLNQAEWRNALESLRRAEQTYKKLLGREAPGLNPEDYLAHTRFSMGNAQSGMDALSAAVAQYESVTETATRARKKSNQPARFDRLIAWSKLRRGEILRWQMELSQSIPLLTEAIEDFQRYRRENPDDHEAGRLLTAAQIQLAQAFALTGNQALAIRNLHAALDTCSSRSRPGADPNAIEQDRTWIRRSIGFLSSP